MRRYVFRYQTGDRAADKSESQVAHRIAITGLEKLVWINQIHMQNVHSKMIADELHNFPTDADESDQSQ
jgi:hypothetical protein